MKKNLLAQLSFCTLVVLSADGPPKSFGQETVRPIQLALISPIQIFSKNHSIEGFRFSLIYGSNASVKGLDIGLINHSAGAVSGLQYGFIGIAEDGFTGCS